MCRLSAKKVAVVERFNQESMYGRSAKSGPCRKVALSRGSTVFVFQNFINRDLKISLDLGLYLFGLRVETC